MPQAVAVWVAEALATSGTYSAGVYTVAYSATTYAVAYAATYVATTAAVVYGSQAIAKRGGGNDSAFADQGRNVMSRDPVSAQRKIYGQVPVSGPMYPIAVTGTKNEFFWFAVLLAGHECAELGDLYFGAEALNDGMTGTPTGKYAGNALIGRHLGTSTQLVDSNLAAALPGIWTSTHRGRGIAHLIVKLRFDTEIFTGLPTPRCMVKGAKVYDPRDGAQDPADPATWVWSSNAALCAADYLHDARFGRGVPWSRIDMAALIEAANVCDENVVLADASTEKRYTVNGTLLADQDRKAVLRDLADAMAGMIIDIGGRWTIRAGAWRTPTVTLGDGDLAGGVSVQTRQSMQDTFNGVKGVFISPVNDWQAGDFPGVKNDTYMAADGGVRRWKDIALNYTISSPTSQRIAKIDLERGRQQITFSALYKLNALRVIPGDVVLHNRAKLGWVNKPFEATDWALRVYDGEGGGKCLGVAVTWRETAQGVWDWANGSETTDDLAPNTALPNPSAISAPTGLALLTDSTTSIFQGDGTFVPRLKVTWNVPNNIYVENGGFTRIEYKKSADSAWLIWNTVRGDLLLDYITDVVVGVSYDVRIQHLSGNGVRSNDGAGNLTYNTVTGYTIAGDTAAPATPTGFAASIGTGKTVSLAWTANTEKDLLGYRIYRNTVNNPATAVLIAFVAATKFVDVTIPFGVQEFYWLTAVDDTNNESAKTASVNATATGVATGATVSSPTAPTNTSSGFYTVSDGSVFSYLEFSISADPAGAIGQTVQYKKHTDSQWVALGNYSGAQTGIRIPDLSPGVQYDVSVYAYNSFGDVSSTVSCASNPITAPAKTTAPAAPTGLTVDGKVVAKKFDASNYYFGLHISWAANTESDLDHYEVKVTSTNADGATDYTFIPQDGSDVPTEVKETSLDVYKVTLPAAYVRVRAVNRSGLPSPWTNAGADQVTNANIGVIFGSASGTVAQGNDSRITGAAQKANNLSDIPSASTARGNLGLGSRAVENSGDAINIGGNEIRASGVRYDGHAANKISFYWDGTNVRAEVDGSLQGTIPNP